MDEIFEQLRELTGISGLCGHEERVIAYMVKKLEAFTDTVTVDYSGNVTATFRGTQSPEMSLLALGHMDEVGLMVRKITEDGYLLFERLGGPSEKTLRSQFVDVFTLDEEKSYPGVIGTKAHHLTPDDEKLKVPGKLDMYIDIGAATRQEVLALGIEIGSTVTYQGNFKRLGASRVASKTLDNRVAVYALLQLAAHLKQCPPKITVHVGFSAQEEFNVRGSLPMVHRLKPDMVISLDCSVACDTPDLKLLYDVSLGKGPVISQMNSYGKGPSGGLIPNPRFRAFIEAAAVKNGIPFQREVVSGVLSDASFASMEGSMGTIAAHIAYPMRYAHSPVEVADTNDIKQMIRLLSAVADELDSSCDFSRYRK